MDTSSTSQSLLCTNILFLLILTDTFVGYTEDSQVNPLCAYGKMKVKGEEIVLNSDPRNLVLRVSVSGRDIFELKSYVIHILFSKTCLQGLGCKIKTAYIACCRIMICIL